MRRTLAVRTVALCMAVGATAQLPATLQQASRSGAISGTVVDGATKQPVADALVQLRWPEQRQFPDVQPRQFTDAKGRFLFSNLPAGDAFTLTASKPGLFEAALGVERRMYESGATIALSEGQWFSSAALTLWPPGSISGTVTDERGEPIVNVFVRVLAEVRAAGSTHWAISEATLTDDRGSYRVGMLAPGRYRVMVPSAQAATPASATPSDMRLRTSANTPTAFVDIDGDPTTRLALLGYPVPPPPVSGRGFAYPIALSSGPSLGQAATVDLDVGIDRTGVDIRLTPQPVSRITGRVEGPSELRAHCLLRLLPAGLEELGWGAEAATTMSAADGSFTFANVPVGNYTVDAPLNVTSYLVGEFRFLVSPRAYPPGMGGGIDFVTSPLPSQPGFGVVSGSASGRTMWARVPVSVGAREESGVVVALRSPFRLSGRFVAEPSPGRPAQTFSAPYVEVESAYGSTLQGRVRESGRQPGGQFAVEGLVPGTYHVRADGPSWRVKSLTIGGRDYTHRPVDLTSSMDDAVITFTNDTTTISGSVVPSDPKPSLIAAVIAFPVESELWVDYGITPSRIRSVRTSTSGQFAFSNLPAGSYFLVAVPVARIHGWTEPDFFKRAQPHATRVTIQWGDVKSASLQIADIR